MCLCFVEQLVATSVFCATICLKTRHKPLYKVINTQSYLLTILPSFLWLKLYAKRTWVYSKIHTLSFQNCHNFSSYPETLTIVCLLEIGNHLVCTHKCFGFCG